MSKPPLRSCVFIRGSTGLVVDGPKSLGGGTTLEENPCKFFSISANGARIVWGGDPIMPKVYDLTTNSQVFQVLKAKITSAELSPSGKFLSTFEPVGCAGDGKNFIIWDVDSNEPLKSLKHPKQKDWAPQWSDDENLCIRFVNTELHFFENMDFSRTTAQLQLLNGAVFAIAPGAPPYKVATCIPGVKGAPTTIKIFQYPNVATPGSAVCSKSFYKADRTNFIWHKRGLALLTLTSTESSDSSYYGEQALHFMTLRGDPTTLQLNKPGPIYAAEFHPTDSEFAVCYGYMPAKVCIFNFQCQPIFDFGTKPRNALFYNPQGNLLCLTGFGNLRGYIEIWHAKEHKMVNSFQAADSTQFNWAPDGVHFMTATTSPRLRVGNGYQFWHVNTGQFYKYDCQEGEFVFEAAWRPIPQFSHVEPAVKIPTAQQLQQKTEAAKPAVYRPPSARNKPPTESLHKYEEAHDPNKPKLAGVDEAEGSKMSKTALKNKKKREAKARVREETGISNSSVSNQQTTKPQQNDQRFDARDESGKRMSALKKKLSQIEKLKEQQRQGKTLEKNQLDKIASEQSLIDELNLLNV